MRWIMIISLCLSGVRVYAEETIHDTGQLVEDRINLSIEKEPIESAMRMLAESAGVNVLLSPSIKGEVNAHIVDMEPRAALEQTILANGFYFVVHENVYSVMSSEEYYEDRDEGRERRIFHLKYARPIELSETLKGALSKKAVIVPYPSASAIVVSEVTERWEEVEQMIVDLDRPSKARVFPLSHAPAEQLVDLLRQYSTDPNSIQADFRTNQIAISDTEPNMAVLESLIEKFDRPDKVSTRTIHLRFAPADEVANLVREILTGQRTQADGYSNQSGTGNNSNPGPGQGLQTPTAQVLPPLSRDNRSTPLESRSFTGNASSGSAASAPSMPANAPQSLPSGTQNTGGGTSGSGLPSSTGDSDLGLGPLATVTADKRTNSVIITHTSEMLDRLAAVIETIDIPNALHTYTFVNIDPVVFDLETKLAGLLGGEQPYIALDDIHRQVTFRCPPEQADSIMEILKKWDSVVQQVRIEAEVLSVNSSLAQSLGISWQALENQVQGAIANPAVRVINDFSPVLSPGSPSGSLTIGNLPGEDFTATITALATDSDTQVLARPSVLVRNNEEAVFTSAREEPYTVVTVAGDTQTTLQDVRFLDVGITLAVTPTIHPDEQISIKIRLENSDLVQVRDGIPVVDRASAESTVGVKAGGTIILGGLRQRSRTLTRNGVPGLRKIPVVGNLFRNKKNNRTDFDIVLVLRPTLIDPSTSDESKHKPLVSEIEDFVDGKKANVERKAPDSAVKRGRGSKQQ